MAARARYLTSGDDQENKQHNGDENLTSERSSDPFESSSSFEPLLEFSGLNEILMRWNHAVTTYRSNQPDEESSLTMASEEHRYLMSVVATAPLLPEDTKTTILKYLFYNRGLIESRRGDHQAAVKYFQKSVLLDNNFVISFFGLGVAHYRLEEYVASACAFKSIQAVMAAHGLDHWDTDLTIDIFKRDQGTCTHGTRDQGTHAHLAEHMDVFVLSPTANNPITGTPKVVCIQRSFIKKLLNQAYTAQEITEAEKNQESTSSHELWTEQTTPSNELENGEATKSSEPMAGASSARFPAATRNEKEKLKGHHPDASGSAYLVLDVSPANVKETEHAYSTNGPKSSGPMTSIAPANFPSASIHGKDNAQDKNGTPSSYMSRMTDRLKLKGESSSGKQKETKKKIKPMISIPPNNIAVSLYKGPIEKSLYPDVLLFLHNATTADATNYSPAMGYHQAITDIARSPRTRPSLDGFPYPELRRSIFMPDDDLETTAMEGPSDYGALASYHEVVTDLAERRRETAATTAACASPRQYESPTKEITEEDKMYHDMVKGIVMSDTDSPILTTVSPITSPRASATRSLGPACPPPTKPLPPLPNHRGLQALTPPNWVPPAGLEVLQPIVYVDHENPVPEGMPLVPQHPADRPLPRESVRDHVLKPILERAQAAHAEETDDAVEEKRRIRKESTDFLKKATRRRRIALGLAPVAPPLPEFHVENWDEEDAALYVDPAGAASAPLAGGSGFSPVVGKRRAVTDAVAPYHQPGEWQEHVPTLGDMYFLPGDDLLDSPTEEEF